MRNTFRMITLKDIDHMRHLILLFQKMNQILHYLVQRTMMNNYFIFMTKQKTLLKNIVHLLTLFQRQQITMVDAEERQCHSSINTMLGKKLELILRYQIL